MILGATRAQPATRLVTVAQWETITRRNPDALVLLTADEWSVEVGGCRYVVARAVSAA